MQGMDATPHPSASADSRAGASLLLQRTIGYRCAGLPREGPVQWRARRAQRPAVPDQPAEAGLGWRPKTCGRRSTRGASPSPATRSGLINISIGETRHPEVEREILDEVGSYGRQLGHIGDALEVLIDHFDQSALGQPEKDALAILKGELAEIRKVKRRELAASGELTPAGATRPRREAPSGRGWVASAGPGSSGSRAGRPRRRFPRGR